jgi:Transglutaminase-like superfamily
VSIVRRALHVAELVALRLSLPVRLARQPLDELLASLTPPACAPPGPVVQDLHRGDLLRAERGIARLRWVTSSCLYRALARYALLRRIGVEADFVMGLDKKGVAKDGHAWIEFGGAPFEEPDDVSRYVVTFRFPSASAATNARPF